MLLLGRRRPVLNDIDLFCLHFYFHAIDDVTEEFHFIFVKLRFFKVDSQAVIEAFLQHLLDNFLVFGLYLSAMDKDVVDVSEPPNKD